MRPSLAILVVLSFCACNISACSKGEEVSTQNPPSSKDSDSPATVVFEGNSGPVRVKVEIARYPEEIRRGLMHRRQMPQDHGMLFLMGREEQQSFWMKNTLIPLDMVFVRKDKSILGIVENAEPKTLTSRRVEGPSLYVIEVKGVFTAKHGIKAGTNVRFEGVRE